MLASCQKKNNTELLLLYCLAAQDPFSQKLLMIYDDLPDRKPFNLIVPYESQVIIENHFFLTSKCNYFVGLNL